MWKNSVQLFLILSICNDFPAPLYSFDIGLYFTHNLKGERKNEVAHVGKYENCEG